MITFPEYHCDVSKIEFTIDCIINLDKHDYPRIDSNGSKIWRNKEGQVHRVNGPAKIYDNGTFEYWVNDKFHREDGPAIVYYDGSEEYYQEDKRHRLDGPAVIYADGYKSYWVGGEIHRVDGPARIRADGREEYY